MNFAWVYWLSLYLGVMYTEPYNSLFRCEMVLEPPLLAPEACSQEDPLFPVWLLGKECSLPLPPSLPLGPSFLWLARTAQSSQPASQPAGAQTCLSGLGRSGGPPTWLLSGRLPDRCPTPYRRAWPGI